MDCGMEFAVDKTNCLVPFFLIPDSYRGDDDMRRIVENALAEQERQSMLESIYAVLVDVIIEIHAILYVFYTVKASESRRSSRAAT